MTRIFDASLTIGHFRAKYAGRGDPYREIRRHARSITRTWHQVCMAPGCNYRKHVETCHLTPIADFPATTSITQINDPSNLILLCPNHHKEFDSGELVVEDRISGLSDKDIID